MNISKIISYWGYPSEKYEVITADGYILQLNRIPHGKNDANHFLVQNPVVYLQHGLFITGSVWISSLPNRSPGFLLADAGYDVRMRNSRGSRWSQKHLYLKTESKEFWAFSYDEMIKYDLPVTIDFFVKKIGQKQMYYVGYSLGTTVGFGAFATNPQLAEKIKIYFALAPVNTLRYITTIVCGLASIEPTLFKPTPLFYDMRNMKVSTAMWSGGRDNSANPIDV
ncbi:gastric triacylglycerol lipase-like [Muntiacus reevesi]|uniref:gastric triacylglycerol lipase-like n=1 Tax=Muntiacus reevesi TaxID=9886 RepID=UPI003306FEFD